MESPTERDKSTTYRIVSFDGGGIRGAFTTQVLLRLTQPPYNVDLSKVKLFAGTSTGSVIATGLAMGLPIDTVANFYREDICKFIFSRKRFFGLNVLGSKYDRGPLKEFLTEQYTGNPQFEDLKYKLALPSFKLQSQYTKNWLCVFFHNRQVFDKPAPTSIFDYRNLRVVDAVLASSAAPTYFPAYEIPDRGSYIDGGVVANNPGVAGLSVALNPKYPDTPKLEDIRLLSIGNGGARNEIEGAPKWGIAGWIKPLMDILSDGVSDADHYYCMSILGTERYRRLQVSLDKPVVLDDYKSVPRMVELAYSEEPKFKEHLQEIADWFNAD